MKEPEFFIPNIRANEFSSLKEAILCIINDNEGDPVSFRTVHVNINYYYPLLLKNKNGETIHWNPEEVGLCVKDIERERGIKILRYPEYENHIDMSCLNIPQKESLAYFLGELPKISEKLKASKSSAYMIESNGGRGHVIAIDCKNKTHVVKTVQGDYELSVAKVASEKGFGPKMYEINNNVLFEEFLVDEIDHIDSDDVSQLIYAQLCAQSGFLGKVHKEGIFIDHDFLRELRYIIKNDEIKARMVDWGTCSFSDNPQDFIKDCEYLQRATEKNLKALIKPEYLEEAKSAAMECIVLGYSKHMKWPIPS